MTHFAIEPDTIAPLAGDLRRTSASLEPAATLTSPDTGVTTSACADAVSAVSRAGQQMALDLTGLGDRVDAAVTAYRETDGQVSWMVDETLAGLG